MKIFDIILRFQSIRLEICLRWPVLTYSSCNSALLSMQILEPMFLLPARFHASSTNELAKGCPFLILKHLQPDILDKESITSARQRTGIFNLMAEKCLEK